MKKKQGRDKLISGLITRKMSKLKTTKILCLTAVTTLLIGGCATVDDKVNPYSFDTAKIEYTLEGSVAGTQTVHIKGDMSAHRTVADKKVDDIVEKMEMLYIEAGQNRYEINLLTKEGTVSPNPIYEEMSRMNRSQKIEFLTRIATFTDEGEQTPASTGEKQISGQTCQMYKIKEIGEICLWNGIPLYSKLSLANGEIENIMTATSIQTGIVVEDNEFGIPADVTVGDLAAA